MLIYGQVYGFLKHSSNANFIDSEANSSPTQEEAIRCERPTKNIERVFHRFISGSEIEKSILGVHDLGFLRRRLRLHYGMFEEDSVFKIDCEEEA